MDQQSSQVKETSDENSAAFAEIRITYEGDALLESHSIDAEKFAQSISAASRILKEISRTCYGHEFSLQLKIRTVEPNCISAELMVFLSRTAETIHFLANNPLTSVLEDILKIGGYCASVYSVYSFWRWMKKRRIKKTERKDDMVTVVLEDGESAIVPLNVYRAIQNKNLSKDVERHLRLLQSEEIDAIRYYQKIGGVYHESTKLVNDDIGLVSLDSEEEVAERERDVVVEFNRPSYYNESRGWRLVQEGKIVPITVTIKDKDFLKDVAEGRLLVLKGQKFRMHLIEKQSSKQKKPKYEATVVAPLTSTMLEENMVDGFGNHNQ